LTFSPSKAYIRLNSARRRLGATARLRSSSLIFGDQASDPNRKPTGFDGLPEGGTASVPGCLTGESEERETWTAESLRAAFLEGKPLRMRPDETSAVDVSGQHLGHASDRSGTSSNVVISREKFSSNLRV